MSKIVNISSKKPATRRQSSTREMIYFACTELEMNLRKIDIAVKLVSLDIYNSKKYSSEEKSQLLASMRRGMQHIVNEIETL